MCGRHRRIERKRHIRKLKIRRKLRKKIHQFVNRLTNSLVFDEFVPCKVKQIYDYHSNGHDMTRQNSKRLGQKNRTLERDTKHSRSLSYLFD